jgi:23S rRNA (pseudouridine1915-N3)-methyltransferase
LQLFLCKIANFLGVINEFMKIIFLVVGKTNESWLNAGIAEYEKRLGHYTAFNFEVIADVKAGKRSADEVKKLEGEAILKFLDVTDKVILLDENGVQYSSRKFAAAMQKWMNASPKRLVFIVGGAFGFAEDVVKRAESALSLSKMTFTHQMIRPFFVEQLYRAFTILKGEKYHND